MKHLTEEELIGRYYNERGGEGEDFAARRSILRPVRCARKLTRRCRGTWAK